MAEPAHAGADSREPPPGRPDPRKPIWADVRHALIVQAEACAKSAAELADRPDDDAALEMLRLCVTVLESLGEMGRQWVVDDVVLEAVRDRAFREGVAACKAARCHLQVIDGGHA